MKSIKVLFALALAASFASAAAAETTLPLIKVPKTEAAMQATRAMTARDAANNVAKPAAHKAKTKAGKGASAKQRKVKASPVRK